MRSGSNFSLLKDRHDTKDPVIQWIKYNKTEYRNEGIG